MSNFNLEMVSFFSDSCQWKNTKHNYIVGLYVKFQKNGLKPVEVKLLRLQINGVNFVKKINWR